MVQHRRNLVARASGQQEASKKVVAAALAASFLFGGAAFAEMNPGEKFLSNSAVGLNKCSENKKFQKMKAKEVKGLQRRMKGYEEGSSVYEALKKSVARTEERFANIANSGRFCETITGNPVYLSDPGLQIWTGRTSDILLPTAAFVYFNCWLFHAGRKQLQWIRETSKTAQEARDRELATNWDYKMSLKFLAKGWAWPVEVVNEIRAKKLTADDRYITDAPL